jgi:hypothetical protein
MKKKNSEPDYSDQYDSFPRDSRETDELRAWMIYEYARESKTLLRLVEEHKKGLVCPDLGDALGIIKDFSVPVYHIVKAMGLRPSFAKSWVELTPALRKKMIAGCRVPAVSIAPENVVRDCLGDDPVLGWGRRITSKLRFGTDEPQRFFPILLNAELTKVHLLQEINNFFDKELKTTSGIGRSPKNTEFLQNALRALATLRILSTRATSDARKAAELRAPHLFSRDESDRRWHEKIKLSQDIFKQLFPLQFNKTRKRIKSEMVSYKVYKNKRKLGRKRNL